MLKYIQFCIFNIKRYILLYDYEFYYRPESQQSQQKFRKYFYCNNTIFHFRDGPNSFILIQKTLPQYFIYVIITSKQQQNKP